MQKLGLSPAKEDVNLLPIARETISVAQLEMKFNDIHLSKATGFLWHSERALYLVTNWHNVAGRNALTGKCLNKMLSRPNRVSTTFHMLCSEGVMPVDFDLDWEFGVETQWLEHPLGSSVDVVMCRISTPPEGFIVHPINASHSRLRLAVSSDVFLLGYPLGLGVEGTPIWKKGSIASEPHFDVEGLPKMLVDTASNCGMSGSPVISTNKSGFDDKGRFINIMGEVRDFVGIYSGRVVHDRKLGAQLGVVWKARVLDEILAAQKRFVPEH
ncbi:S1 family peptidase [Leisingera sp. ANG1]|uniref:S1 family peptidase n=2 Tax=Leisingera TaxID=191028 RepID=UPI0009E4EC78|nr:serine protease [Leisingera sp. ANG1]